MTKIRRLRVDSHGNVETFQAPSSNPSLIKFSRSARSPFKPNTPTASKGASAPARPSRSPSLPVRPASSKFQRGEQAGKPPRRSFNQSAFKNHDTRPEVKEKLPPLEAGNIRIIPLGGVEEIGKNMTAVEIGNDIVIIDAGFTFPGDDAPGVDYIIPDTTYLEENKSKIRGLLVTHGHLDHIGGIPYLLEKIGNPPIYTSLLTAVMIKKRQEEFPHLVRPNIQVIEHKDKIKLGNLNIRFFATTHTIPDSIGIIIETAYGNIVFTGDLKLDHKDGVIEPQEAEVFARLGQEKTLLLVADSTNVEKPGFSYSEKEVHKNLKELIAGVPGRVVIGTFASLFERVIAIIEACEQLGKKVAIEGRAMKTNIEIAKELGFLKTNQKTIISSEEIDAYPENKIVVLATGAQGDEFAALMRISQKEHRTVKLHKGDTVLLSSSVIPGNEKAVQKLKDNLSRQGAKIIHYGTANVHSSGHSYRGELEWVHRALKPRFLMPVHGHHFMLRVHADLAQELGMPEKNVIVPDNGSVLEIQNKGQNFVRLKQNVSSKIVMVDGLGTGNVQEVVIRDRQLLSQDGMFVLIAVVDMSNGKVRKSPDIISRGFVYLKESQDMLRYVRLLIKKTIEESASKMHPINLDYVKNAVREELGKYLFQKTHKRPIILPVLIEV